MLIEETEKVMEAWRDHFRLCRAAGMMLTLEQAMYLRKRLKLVFNPVLYVRYLRAQAKRGNFPQFKGLKP